MTRRNDKRNNRRNSRQRNNNTEVSPFAQMILGAILSKGAGMIANALMDKAGEKTEDKPHTGIRQSDNLLESSCIINGDGSAIEIPIPDGFQIFISEDGKPMIRKKIEGDEKATNDAEKNKPITYDDILEELYFDKNAYWVGGENNLFEGNQGIVNYKDAINCTTPNQAKRLRAFNKLQNIAKYINGDWKPNFDGHTKNWSINKEINSNVYTILYSDKCNEGSVYFKSEGLANFAASLMGKESLNDLFSTDW